jgi:uncharacterized protein (TIGR00299 family) protein
MNYVYFDAFAGCSGDMILGALLDLGADQSRFLSSLAELGLPVEISVQETRRSALRGLKVDVKVKQKHQAHRKWKDIEDILAQAPFSETVKARALKIFHRLFQSEAQVHGFPFEDTHLHEAGADDALVDIVGFSLLAEMLDIDTFYSSALNVGSGWAKAAHGVLPVPPPAVAELLKGIPVYSAHVDKELVTPTGAAILSTVVKSFSPLPELRYDRVGWGAGTHDLADFPNLLRVFCGQSREESPDERILQIEANIDDSTPQILAGFLEQAIQEGALDVFLTPVVMKKNRLATKLTILCTERLLDPLIQRIFRETSTIGVRYFPVGRRILTRSFSQVKVLGETIRIKVAEMAGETVNIQPEFDDCARAAARTGEPVKDIMLQALQAFQAAGKGPCKDK